MYSKIEKKVIYMLPCLVTYSAPPLKYSAGSAGQANLAKSGDKQMRIRGQMPENFAKM